MKKLFAILCILLCSSLAFATLATPTNVSTTSVSGSTMTVNSTAHGLLAGQGFCIDASAVSDNNFCGLVATASTNSFTYTLQSGQTVTLCAASCGTTRPGPLVMWDRVIPFSDPISQNIQICLFVYVSIGTPKAGATSSCAQASASEVAGLVKGSVVEVSRQFSMPLIESFAGFNNIFLDWQTSAKDVMNGASFTAPQPGAYASRRCDTAGCN